MINNTSLWYSSAHKSVYNESENGMTEYNINTNRIINNIQYPHLDITPCRQFCVEYKENIYIIDGEAGEIILFDPSTKQFTTKIDIPAVGKYPCAVVVFDRIHIFNGSANVEQKHLIYNIKTNTIKEFDDEGSKHVMYCVAVDTYRDRIIRFGGGDLNEIKAVDTFMISSKIEKNKDCTLKWYNKQKYKLPTVLYNFGWVLYKKYLILFAGDKHIGDYVDNVYLLDLEDDDNGWTEMVLFWEKAEGV